MPSTLTRLTNADIEEYKKKYKGFIITRRMFGPDFILVPKDNTNVPEHELYSFNEKKK